MSSTDQSGYTGRHRTEPDGHYHDGSFYTDDECGCELARIARLLASDPWRDENVPDMDL